MFDATTNVTVSVNQMNDAFGAAGVSSENLLVAMKSLGVSGKQLNLQQINQLTQQLGLNSAQKAGIISTLGLDAANKKLAISTTLASIGMAALNAAMTMGLSVIITGLIGAFTAWINKSEEITKKAQEAADAIKDIGDSLKTNTETVNSAKQRYAELAQEVENLGKITQGQGTLNNEEYDEFLDLSNQLAGVFPSLTKNYDDNGNAILDLSGDVDTIVGSLDNLLQKEKELANQKIIENIPDVFTGYVEDLVTAEQAAKSAQTEFDKINNAYQQLSLTGGSAQAFNLQGYGEFFNNDGEKVKVGLAEYTNALEDLGIAYEKTNIMTANQFGGETLSGYLVEATGDINTAFTSQLEEARKNLQYAQQQLEGQKSSFDSYMNTWLQGEFSYNQIENSGLQTAIQDILFNFDFSNIPEDKRGDWDYVSEYLRRNILFEINKVQDDPQISTALSEVFNNTELTPNEKMNYFRQIQQYFGEESSIVVTIKPQIDETEELQEQYNDIIQKTKEKFSDYDPTTFFQQNSINTKDEVNKWWEIAQAANSAAEAEERYIKSQTASNTTFDMNGFTNTMQLYEEKYSKLTSAQEEWNKAKSLSADTFADLQANGLLSYLDFTSQGLTINKEKLLENAKAAKEKAVADLHAAMMSDMLKIALGDVDSVSAGAKTVIDELGDNVEEAGNQALSSVANWATFGATLTTVMAQARGEDRSFNGVSDEQKKQMEAVYDYYKDFAGKVGKIDITTPARTSDSNKKELDIMKELNSELDEIQKGYEAIKEARETYNEHGKITVDQAQEIINTDLRLLAKMEDEENAYHTLANAKLEEMKVQLARNAIDTLNSLKTEADAVEYLAMANVNLRNQTLSANEALLEQAVMLKQGAGGAMADAANTIWQGYQNAVSMIGHTDFGFTLDKDESKDTTDKLLDAFNKERRYLEHLQKMGEISNKEFYDRLLQLAEQYLGGEEHQEELWGVQEEVHDYLESIKETYNWIEKLLGSVSKKVNSLIDKADKFYSWQKKNAMLNRAIKGTSGEISQNQNAYNFYMQKANSVGLSNKYKNKIQNGELSVEELADEELSGKIEEYTEWYDKAQDVLSTINDLYDQERDLIRQKLDNVIDYYADMDSYLSSITSKVESFINLNDAMGKRSSLTELVQQFADVSAQLSAVTEKTSEIKTSVTEINFGESDSVKDAVAKNKKEQMDAIQAEIDNLTLSEETSGTYKKLMDKIAKKEAEVDEYLAEGWDQTKEKQYEKLWAELDDLYDLQAELDARATTNTIKNYEKIYLAYRKLQKKIDNGQELKPGEQKKYDSYWEQLDELSYQGYLEKESLETQLGILKGEIAPETDVEKAQREYDSVQKNLEESGTYKKLEQDIKNTEEKLEKLDDIGFDNLTKKQKNTYKKLTKTLESYYDRRDALDKNATADTVAEYNKIYIAWKKLQDRLDSGKNLNDKQWKNYEKYTKQLKQFEEAKHSLVSDLEEQLEEAKNPGDKLEVIKREYEDAAEGIYDSYQRQIEGVEGAVEETKQYQNLFAKANQLETKKKISGLTKAEENKLNKYNAKLEALRKGGTTENIAEYMSTWEKLYNLEQKIKKNGKLSDKDARNYDIYKAKLEAWNKEKQTQISDLKSLMEDELEALKKTYVENVSEAESEINEYYSNLYDLAKQIAEYNIGILEEQLSLLDSYISYYQQIVDLYDRFSDNKLANLLSDLDIDVADSQESLYSEYLAKLQEKYDTTLSKINEYKELISALEDTNDFSESMQLFQDALAQYRADGQEDVANSLQAVLDLLNERAVDADNWDEYSDEWLNEWRAALADAKTELIGIAGSIQDVNDKLREITFSNITDAIQELNNSQDMLSSIVGLIKDDWMYDANGNLTQYGLTKVGLLVEQMDQAKQEASKYAQLMESIEAMKDTYASTDAYEEAMQEAKMNYLSSIGDLQNYQDSIVAILTKADEAVIDSLKKVIEQRKEALQKKKELYDYDKSIKSSQKEIDVIKAQIAALESLSDQTDATTKAKLAQLKADLADKEEALQETKDEHTYNLQIDALDEFLETLNDTMNNTTDSISATFESYIEAINSALQIYDANKEHLDDWSNGIISTITKLGDLSVGTHTDVKINAGDIEDSDETNNMPLNVINSDTVTAIEATGKETQKAINSLQEIVQSAISDGLLVRVDPQALITTSDKRMFDLMYAHLPNMNSVLRAIQSNAANKQTTTNVDIHYDNLLYVEGNIDRDFSQVLPDYLRQACEYTKKDIYREINRTR